MTDNKNVITILKSLSPVVFDSWVHKFGFKNLNENNAFIKLLAKADPKVINSTVFSKFYNAYIDASLRDAICKSYLASDSFIENSIINNPNLYEDTYNAEDRQIAFRQEAKNNSEGDTDAQYKLHNSITNKEALSDADWVERELSVEQIAKDISKTTLDKTAILQLAAAVFNKAEKAGVTPDVLTKEYNAAKNKKS